MLFSCESCFTSTQKWNPCQLVADLILPIPDAWCSSNRRQRIHRHSSFPGSALRTFLSVLLSFSINLWDSSIDHYVQLGCQICCCKEFVFLFLWTPPGWPIAAVLVWERYPEPKCQVLLLPFSDCRCFFWNEQSRFYRLNYDCLFLVNAKKRFRSVRRNKQLIVCLQACLQP